MMRYSEISRDLSSESMRYVELNNGQTYKNLREDSPPTDISNYNGPHLNRTPSIVVQPNRYCYDAHQTHGHLQHPQQELYKENRHQPHPANGVGNGCGGARNNSKRFSSCGAGGGMSTSGNGTANGAATICSYMRHRKDSTKSTQSCNFEVDRLAYGVGGAGASKTMNGKSSRRKNSIGCLSSFSTSPGSPGCYYCVSSSTPPNGKSRSLPAQTSMKNLDKVILNALRVPADELANQLTLLDFPVFAAIQPDELTSCAWTTKDKHIVTPNIVAFTKRFNHTSFWTVQEILSGEQPKQRAEIMTHFIKVAKKLHELNNLHSLFAIISGMQSASIYRLKKTWACLSKKDKQAFDRLCDIFSDQNNWENLREYLESLRLPCIPYLGLFLTDLIYIDLAHPHKGGLEPEQRRNKMNNILRVIANYQQSNYEVIQPIEGTQKYLNSIRYIEELQNIFEEDQYKKSLKLEPITPSGPSSSSCSSKESFNADAVTPALACLNLSPAKTIGSMRVASNSKFIPGHRKCRSLGTNIFGRVSHNHSIDPANYNCVFADDQFSVLSQQPRHLLDDSVLEHCHSIGSGDATSIASSEGLTCSSLAGSQIDLMYMPTDGLPCIQGPVRRKTVQKEGRKPAVASWQRYWLQIWANSLVYFPPKSFKGSNRNDFKREPCKVCPLEGWSAQVVDNPKHKNSFELFHRSIGTVYKFRTDSPQASHLWTNSICKVAAHRNAPKPLPTNLMSFE